MSKDQTFFFKDQESKKEEMSTHDDFYFHMVPEVPVKAISIKKKKKHKKSILEKKSNYLNLKMAYSVYSKS